MLQFQLPGKTGKELKQKGSVVAGFTSLLNHSCYPNALLEIKKDCTLVHALVPIKNGEQVNLANEL